GGLVLPGDLVGVAADGAKGTAHRRADRRRLGTAVKSLPERKFGIVPSKGAGAYRGRDIKAARFRVVRHRPPVGAADPRWLDQHRLFPERLKDAAGLFVAARRHGLGALRHDRIADREGLGLCRFLPRFLRDGPLFDADKWFAVGAVEDIDPTGAAG